MPVHDDAIDTQNIILKGWLGPDRAAGSPDSYFIDLWQENPNTNPSAALVNWGGYVAPEWSSDDWLTPVGGQIASDGLPDFGVPTTSGTGAARFWSLSTAPGVPVYSAPLTAPFSLPADLGEDPDPVKIRLTVPYGRN